MEEVMRRCGGYPAPPRREFAPAAPPSRVFDDARADAVLSPGVVPSAECPVTASSKDNSGRLAGRSPDGTVVAGREGAGPGSPARPGRRAP